VGGAILAAAVPFLGSFSGNARQNAGLPKCFSDDVLVAMEQDWFEENAAVPSLRSYGIVRWSAARWRSLLKGARRIESGSLLCYNELHIHVFVPLSAFHGAFDQVFSGDHRRR
jgi:hypothetical protein